MFPSSFTPLPFPHRRLHLHHQKGSIITVSSDEAKVYSAPPKRLYTNRHIFFLIRSHDAVGARSRADTAWLHPRQRRRPLPPRRRSLNGNVHISRTCYFLSSRSHCCSALALGPLPGLLLLLLLLALLLSLLLLLAMLLRFSYTSVD